MSIVRQQIIKLTTHLPKTSAFRNYNKKMLWSISKSTCFRHCSDVTNIWYCNDVTNILHWRHKCIATILQTWQWWHKHMVMTSQTYRNDIPNIRQWRHKHFAMTSKTRPATIVLFLPDWCYRCCKYCLFCRILCILNKACCYHRIQLVFVPNTFKDRLLWKCFTSDALKLHEIQLIYPNLHSELLF